MSGATESLIDTALRCEAEGRSDEALRLFEQAVSANDDQARYLLALRLLQRGVDGAERTRALDLLSAAVAVGVSEALNFAIVAQALGLIEGAPNWPAAMAQLEDAARRGDAFARGQRDVLGAGFDARRWLALSPPVRPHFTAPRVGVIEGFISPAMCAWIVARAKPHLSAAEVLDNKTGRLVRQAQRTNSGVYIDPARSDIVIQLAKARIAHVLGVPLAHQEYSNILHYSVGQKFDTHVDFLDPNEAAYRADLQRAGQRIATFLIYLNEDYEGGETDFPVLGWRHKGKIGDALVFWNVSVNGEVERRLLHAGLPPSQGEKWLFSQWVRSRPLPLI